ncbi:MAG: cellulase family glycosylhydrolase [Gordonia sp. (in: high G+C Gram-positive bacteria)]|uniref:cellulase family glycosylhydrolase n=1 Tax=Gordonia TaxID=2053 RepID=UPI003262E30D
MRRGVAAAAALIALLAIVPAMSERPTSPALAAFTQEFGVASIATLADRTTAGYEREADAIRAVGGTWIRIVMNWNETETGPGYYKWERLDRAVDAARSRGLRVLGLVAGPAPAWAAIYPDVQGSPPRSAADYASFSAALASRYRGRVAAWELWNEPNLRGYWINPDPAAYAQLLKASYPRIKAADRNALVVAGGTSPDVSGIPVGPFLTGLYVAGARGSFDAVGLHPYTFPQVLGATGFDPTVAAIRAIMDAAGDAGKRIWITEWGQPTGTSPIAVSEERQADVIVLSMAYVRRQPRMGPMFLFTSKDWKTDPSQADFNFGLYRYDYSPKPVVARLQQIYRN